MFEPLRSCAFCTSDTGPQGVQSDANTSGLSTELGVLITTNTKYRDVIVIAKGKKRANRYDTGANDKGITRKRINNERDSL